MAGTSIPPVRDILVQYSRFFFGHENEEIVADGILALEHNWLGPLAINGSVETTFAYWKTLDEANPQLCRKLALANVRTQGIL